MTHSCASISTFVARTIAIGNPRCATTGRTTRFPFCRLTQRRSRPCSSHSRTHQHSQYFTSSSNAARSVCFAVSAAVLVTYVLSGRKELLAEAREPKRDVAIKQHIVTRDELEKHTSGDDCWVAIGGKVYNVTDFLEQHPGGADMILEHAGKDITTIFSLLHPKGTLDEALSPEMEIGLVDPRSPPAQTGQREALDEIEARRQALPPAASVLNLATFGKYAKEVLGEDSPPWCYISGWADDGAAYTGNREAYRLVRFLPRVARAVSDCLPSASVLGKQTALPVYISGTGFNRSAHPDGELNSLRCAHKNNLIHMVSNVSSVPLQEIVDERQRLAEQDDTSPATLWFQLYLRNGDRTRNVNDLRIAAAAKVDAIVLTVDAVALGNHERSRNNPERLRASAPSIQSKGLKPLPLGTLESDITWGEMDFIRQNAPNIPLIVKGVQSVDDIELAMQHGASAVVLSNHGARRRQMDYSSPPLAILARTRIERPELLKRVEVYVDGGITRGTDVLKALALGAKAVGVGRVPIYAQACYGEEGITRAFQILSDEITTGLRLLGCKRVTDLRPELLEIMPGLLGKQLRSEDSKN